MRSTKRFIIVSSGASFLSALLIGCLALLLLTNDGPFSIIVSTIAAIKVAIVAVFMQCLLSFLVFYFYSPDVDVFHFKIAGFFKCCAILGVSCLTFHTVAVCFGAPFFISTTETFHFAMLLTVCACLPCCLFLGSNIDGWLEAFTTNSSEISMDTVVYFTTIGAVFGSWLGAVPIPLDWDRPWQEWPISCVIGTLLGYSGGLMLSAIQLPRKYTALQKSKVI